MTLQSYLSKLSTVVQYVVSSSEDTPLLVNIPKHLCADDAQAKSIADVANHIAPCLSRELVVFAVSVNKDSEGYDLCVVTREQWDALTTHVCTSLLSDDLLIVYEKRVGK